MNKTVLGQDKEGNKIEMNISDLSWRISVYGIAIKDEKVLMISQNFGYALPGGAVELGEKHEDTLVREIFEESGYKVKAKKLLDVQTSFFRHPLFNKDIHSIRIFFECEIEGGDLNSTNLLEAEKSWGSKPEWVELSELENIKIGDSADLVSIIKKVIN